MTGRSKVDQFFSDQVSSWAQLRTNRKELEKARMKEYIFEGFTVRAQYNPGRITSTSARVDRESIKRRSCFLCRGNRPPEQEGLAFGPGYEILCNPFPIFENHFTIATTVHTPQVIQPSLKEFLELTRYLKGMVVFYNAPACGASAPDHMHFQAGTLGIMPMDRELGTMVDLFGVPVAGSGGRITVSAVEDGIRKFLVLESPSFAEMEYNTNMALEAVREMQSGEEPMVNVLSYYTDQWKLVVFPREKHRPWQYFEKGGKNILLSPASVDMGGTLITPLEKDFIKLRKEDVVDIYRQVSYTDERFHGFIELFKSLVS